MPSRETIDERYEDIARELRLLPGAPEGLRDRVAELAEREPAPEPRRFGFPRLGLRQLGFAAAASVGGIALAAGVYGFATSADRPGDLSASAGGGSLTTEASQGIQGASTTPAIAKDRAVPPPPAPPPPSGAFEDDSGPLDGGARAAAPSPVATGAAPGAGALSPASLPTGTRLARYEATMRLRVDDVDDLSRRTAQAMRIARRLGGFVAVVRYGTPAGGEGDAFLRLRIPAPNVQDAVVRFSQLGTIVSQRVNIVDLEERVSTATDDIGRLRATIRRLQAELKDPNLEEYERIQLRTQLANARALLKRRVEGREQTIRSGRLSTVSLTLTTRDRAEVVVPKQDGRIERSARNALTFLSKGTAVAVFLLIVLSPLILLGIAAAVANGFRRRRIETRLLETA